MAECSATDQQSQEHGGTVAKHYNQLKESGLDVRTQSRIFYLRNFNNWIKSMAIGDMLNQIKRNTEGHDISVLDLCSGKGGDLLKWKKGKISKLICADIAETSVEQCENRYKEMVERNAKERFPQKLFTAQFIAADCSKQRLKDLYKEKDIKFDLCSCQFSFHYSFESPEQADLMMKNACECLKPGGYFIGTTPNCYELVKRLRVSSEMKFGNEVYSVTFKTPDKDNLPLYGCMYDFHLEGVVDCPEFLVYFPLLEKIAANYGMKLVYRKPFEDFFKEFIETGEGRALIGKMQALEPYPPEEDVELMSSVPHSYKHASSKLEELKSQPSTEDDGRQRRKPLKLGTLSQDEWEATTLYLAFAFQKLGGPEPRSDVSSEGYRKRPHAAQDTEEGLSDPKSARTNS